MRRARRVDRNHSEIRTVLRALCPAVEDTSDVGRGFSDLMMVRTHRGTVLLVEVKDGAKSASRRALTPDEAAFANRWQGNYVIVSSVDEAIAASRR